VYADRPVQLYRRLAELAQVPPVPPPAVASLRSHSAGEGTGGTVLPDESFPRVAWAGAPARAVAHPARAEVPAYSTPDVGAFAQLAAMEFEGSILRYSRRLALLKMAEQMKIGRFEANLIIALIQHRLSTGETGPTAQEAATTPPRFGRFLPLATFLLLQTAIIWGIWQLFA